MASLGMFPIRKSYFMMGTRKDESQLMNQIPVGVQSPSLAQSISTTGAGITPTSTFWS